MNRSQARLLIRAVAGLTGGVLMEPELPPLKSSVNAEIDLKAKVNKPVNGYQAKVNKPVNGYQVKQRKRKLRRKGVKL